MKYSLATNWDDNLLAKVKQIKPGPGNQIDTIFGSLSNSIIGNARAITPFLISPARCEKHIKLARDLGFRFNYLLNSNAIPDLADSKVFKRVCDYMDWLSSLDIDIFTVADPKLLKFLDSNFPQLKINISIVWGIKTIKGVNDLRRKFKQIKRITLHQTINRDIRELIAHLQNAHKKTKSLMPVELELLANEICLYGCRHMKAHYRALSIFSQAGEGDFQEINSYFKRCNKIRRENPLELLNSPWIRPEDVRLYKKIGVDYLKLSGREETTEFLLRLARAYLMGKFKGNFLDLTGSSYWPQGRLFIDNRKLNGFIEYLWQEKRIKLKDIPEAYKINYGENFLSQRD